MTTWTVVHYAYEGDGVTALYDNEGNLHTHGDYYHDKIAEYLNGFFAGMLEMEAEFDRVDLYVSDEEIDIAYEEIPDTLAIAREKYTVTDDSE